MLFFEKIAVELLSDSEQLIYQYLVENGEKVPYMRVRELATESCTSASTVMRFIRKLGYESFSDFKRNFKLSYQQATLSQSFNVSLLKEKNFPRDLKDRLLVVGQQILESENIIFFGIGSSGSICAYAARRISALGCHTFSMLDATYPLAAKLKHTRNNLLIVLSVTGMTTEILEMVNGFRHSQQMTIVAITSDVNSTLARMADVVLDYRIEVRKGPSQEDLTSQIPSIFLIEALSKTVEELQKSNQLGT